MSCSATWQWEAPVVLDVAPGPNGVAVLNGLQISSRGTSPPRLLAAGRRSGAGQHEPLVPRNPLRREGVRYRGAVCRDVRRGVHDHERDLRAVVRGGSGAGFARAAGCAADCEPGQADAALLHRARELPGEAGPHRQDYQGGAAEPDQLSRPGRGHSVGECQRERAGRRDAAPERHAARPGEEGHSKVSGFLGSDRTLAMRWQSKAAEVTRKSLVTAYGGQRADHPDGDRSTTALRYEILQAAVPRLTVALPAAHALTRIEGEQIRDWQVKPDGERQALTIEFIKPVEKACNVTLLSEQAVETRRWPRRWSRPSRLKWSANPAPSRWRGGYHRRNRCGPGPAAGQCPSRRARVLPLQRPALLHPATIQRIAPVLKSRTARRCGLKRPACWCQRAQPVRREGGHLRAGPCGAARLRCQRG